MQREFNIVVLPGDGIGVEVIDANLAVLEPLMSRHGFRLRYDRRPGGARHYRDTGNAFPDASMSACEKADAILFGARGWLEIRYPMARNRAAWSCASASICTRASARYVPTRPAVAARVAAAGDIDFVIVRESTEGWFTRVIEEPGTSRRAATRRSTTPVKSRVKGASGYSIFPSDWPKRGRSATLVRGG